MDVVHAHALDAPAFDRLRGYPRPVVHTLHLPPVEPGVVAAARAAAPDATLTTNSQANAAAWRAAARGSLTWYDIVFSLILLALVIGILSYFTG